MNCGRKSALGLPFSVPFWQSKKEHDDSRNSGAKLAHTKQKMWLSTTEVRKGGCPQLD